MAETMMLTLDGHLEHTSIGADLLPEMLHKLRQLAGTHGFHVAKLRSFGHPLNAAEFQRRSKSRQLFRGQSLTA
jgi:hypothetical protein